MIRNRPARNTRRRLYFLCLRIIPGRPFYGVVSVTGGGRAVFPHSEPRSLSDLG